jgi:hypothetical protein
MRPCVEHDAARAGGALVQGQQMGHGKSGRVRRVTQLTPARPAGREGLGRRLVGEQACRPGPGAQLHHRRAVELAVVGGQPDLARLLDDGTRHLHLAVVEVAQRAVGLDAGDADQADVDLELRMKSTVASPTMPRSRAAHHAAGDDDLAVRVVRQDGGHVQVVGDHAQPAVAQQLTRDRLGGGADVEDQRAAVGHRCGHGAGDALLGLVVELLALAVGDVLGGRTGSRTPP